MGCMHAVGRKERHRKGRAYEEEEHGEESELAHPSLVEGNVIRHGSSLWLYGCDSLGYRTVKGTTMVRLLCVEQVPACCLLLIELEAIAEWLRPETKEWVAFLLISLEPLPEAMGKRRENAPLFSHMGAQRVNLPPKLARKQKAERFFFSGSWMMVYRWVQLQREHAKCERTNNRDGVSLSGKGAMRWAMICSNTLVYFTYIVVLRCLINFCLD
jgi:hypothetical protein